MDFFRLHGNFVVSLIFFGFLIIFLVYEFLGIFMYN